MRTELATVLRIAALVLTISVLAFQGVSAQDAEESEVEAREEAGVSDGFVPPLTGAPEKRMGAASRELGAAVIPCEEGDAAAEDGHCADANVTTPQDETGTDAASQ